MSEITSCPFCTNSIRKHTFAETNLFIAVYNIAPILPGHSLIIPKRHVVSFFDLRDDERKEMIDFVDKIGRVLKSVYHGDGFNLSLQDDWSAGQSVDHLHLHLLIRKTGDLAKPGDWYRKIYYGEAMELDLRERSFLAEEKIQAEVEKIAKELRRI